MFSDMIRKKVFFDRSAHILPFFFNFVIFRNSKLLDLERFELKIIDVKSHDNKLLSQITLKLFMPI